MASCSQMQTTIYNDSTVQGLVDTWTQSSTTYYMIFDLILLPEFRNGDSGRVEIDVKKKTINHFSVSTESGGSEVIDVLRQVSCRAYTQQDAEAIQNAVFNSLNRVKSSDGAAFFVANKDAVIPPIDDTDNYNAPLTVRTIKTRS